MPEESVMHVKDKLRQWLSAWTKQRKLSKSIPPPRSKFYYRVVGRRKLKPLERSAKSGNAAAQVALASSLLFGAHGIHDTRESLTWTAKAAETGSAHAKFLYGYRHLIGIDGVVDPDMAIQWWKEAAEEGDPQACAHLAWAYHFGFGVTANAEEAVKWESEAAQQGIPSAQYTLGVRYASGDVVERDLIKAYFWFCLATKCRHGDVEEIDVNQLWRFEPNPLGPVHGNACDQARKLRSRLGRDTTVTVEEAVKQWQPGDGYLVALENRA